MADFIIDPEDSDFYEKISASGGSVSPPTFCPQCRLQRRLCFFNERVLYKMDCALCGKSTMTMYRPDSGLIIYCNACYWSDNWDPGAYFRKYDPSRPFLAQVNELIRSTPQSALSTNYPTLINSDYINHSATAKNCYLIFTADYCENVLYSTILNQVKDSMDCLMLEYGELCYETVDCGRCSLTYFSDDCADCVNVYFSKDCRGCSDCFGCFGLRQKSHYFFNKPCSKEEYAKRMEEFQLHSQKGLEKAKNKSRSFWLTRPHRYAHLGTKNLNVTGDYVYMGSKNSKDIYYGCGVEDSRFCQFLTLPTTKECYDYTMWGNGAERLYECFIVGEGARDVKFSNQCWLEVMDVEYSFWTMTSSYMFGCANIRKKEHCILNKQYSKGEYEKLRERIIEDMNKNPYVDKRGRVYRYGEFFPPEMSLHAYNESQANDFFPMKEEEARVKGFDWKALPIPSQKPTLRAEEVPDSIHETSDSIVSEIIECGGCRRPFRIIPAELALLKRFGFPVPRRCFNCRHEDRLRNRVNPPRLFDRVCAKCGAAIRTSYAPGRPEIVYCETCYQQEVM
jgi:hypothetical protein